MYDFEYHRAGSQSEAQEKMGGAEDGRYLAGGMTLIPVLKQRLDNPSDVVDLGDLDDLRGIAEEGGAIVIKAMTTHDAVATSDLIKAKIPALAKLAGSIGDPMVRNRGTIGGSLANSDPAADYPAAVLGLGATIHTAKREIAGDDYFQGMFETALDEGEMITHVSFPIPETADYSRFPNPASRFPIVAVFAAKTSGGARIAVTGAGACAFRVSEMEEALAGGYEASKIEGITYPDTDLNSDIHASAEYRAHLIGVMAKRALGD
jgi:carbon-monoxide dehydrogenase medium subunit